MKRIYIFAAMLLAFFLVSCESKPYSKYEAVITSSTGIQVKNLIPKGCDKYYIPEYDANNRFPTVSIYFELPNDKQTKETIDDWYMKVYEELKRVSSDSRVSRTGSKQDEDFTLEDMKIYLENERYPTISDMMLTVSNNSVEIIYAPNRFSDTDNMPLSVCSCMILIRYVNTP